MRIRWAIIAGVGYLIFAAFWILAAGVVQNGSQRELLNAACDPTRELWHDLNRAFLPRYEADTGESWTVRMSHGGSSSQARAVIDGLQADLVTLAMWPDTDVIRKRGLISRGWEKRLPNRSLPFLSTIVFVVRKGNPRAIHDWNDLVREDIQVITPNPKTSGNGKWVFLAAWGSVIWAGGTDAEAEAYTTALYRRVPVLDTSARGATMTFSQKVIGDVHLTWENEAFLEVEEAKGALEIVYPSRSILAEPHVAWVDAVVDRKGTRAVAEAYLQFLYSEEAQEIIAQHHYRPVHPQVWARHRHRFGELTLHPVMSLGTDWDSLSARFFADGGIFDQVYLASFR